MHQYCIATCRSYIDSEQKASLASNPGLPRPDFISQPSKNIGEFFTNWGCKLKCGRGRPGFEAKVLQ